MPSTKLTNQSVQKLATRSSTYISYDDRLSGFGCRVTPHGSKRWVVEYRPVGASRRAAKKRVTIGPVATLTAEEARKTAKDILARVRLGEDVALGRAKRRVALTVAELAARYLNEEVRPTRKAATAVLYDGYLRTHVLKQLGSRVARDVIRSDIAKLHRAIGAEKPVTANRVVTFLSGVFSWGMANGELPEGPNPCSGLSRFREEGRERYLTSDELARLGDALRLAETTGLRWSVDETRPTAKHAPKPTNRHEIFGPEVTAAIRLLLFTGCRLREILHLRWDEVDFERQLLFLPDSKTGRRPVVLSAPAMDVLRSLKRLDALVIPGRQPGHPRHDLHRPWAALIRYAQLPGLRIHDLRHSFAATGAGAGFGLPIIGKLLGHKNIETTNRYAHVALDPQKLAADHIAAWLAGKLEGGSRLSAADIPNITARPNVA